MVSRSTCVIKKENDYKKFEKHNDNRILHLRKHKRLFQSMKKYGFKWQWPIVVCRNGKGLFKILDGQHRAAIAEELKLPIYYVESAEDFNIAEINDTQKVWQTIDYAEVYAAKGEKDYIEALDFMREHDICITVAFSLLAGTTTYSNIERSFKEGRFKIKDREWAEKVVGVYCPIAGMSSMVKNTRFLDACMAACRVSGFDTSRMIQSADRQRDRLISYSTRDAYLGMMEDIYNHHKSRERLPLKFEAIGVMRERNSAVRKSTTKKRKAPQLVSN